MNDLCTLYKQIRKAHSKCAYQLLQGCERRIGEATLYLTNEAFKYRPICSVSSIHNLQISIYYAFYFNIYKIIFNTINLQKIGEYFEHIAECR